MPFSSASSYINRPPLHAITSITNPRPGFFSLLDFSLASNYPTHMTTITFDTLKFVERLEKAGISRDQATAFSEAQKAAFAEALDTSLATKHDIEVLRTDIAKLDARISGELILVKWMLGVVIAIAIANFAKQFL